MQDHKPSLFSFHKLTLLSPPETPKMFPVSDQLTFQTTSSKVFRIVGVHVVPISSVFQIMTRRSCEQLAIRDVGNPKIFMINKQTDYNNKKVYQCLETMQRPGPNQSEPRADFLQPNGLRLPSRFLQCCRNLPRQSV